MKAHLSTSYEQMRKWVAAIEAETAGARSVSSALQAQLDSLRPILAIDASVIRAAARALGSHGAMGPIRNSGE